MKQKLFLTLTIFTVFLVKTTVFPSIAHAVAKGCGEIYNQQQKIDQGITCTCDSGEKVVEGGALAIFCCGWVKDGSCLSIKPVDGEGGEGDSNIIIDPDSLEVTEETLNAFNPLKIENSKHADQLSTPRGILTRFFQFAFPIAGMILFVLLVWGGFQMMTGAASKKSIDEGKQTITAALIGFLLMFISYWIIQIIEAVFGIDVLGR